MRKSVLCPNCWYEFADSEIPDEWGVTLRDYFAGCALIANIVVGMPVCVNESASEGAARIAYGYADEMMKAREK